VGLAEQNGKIVGITAAMPSGTSLSMMLEAMPTRAFDVGISEGHAVTFAGGLAKDGMHPYCAIYSTFLQRGYDSIIHDVAIQGLPVTFCIDRGGIVGEDGVTHHGLFDIAYLRCIPGMIVASPINEHDLRNLMFTAQQDGVGPFAIRYPRGKGVLVEWRNPMEALPIGRGRCMSQGEGVAVLSIGHIGNEVIDVVNHLSQQGIHVGHYDMIFAKPIDEAILEEATMRYRSLITIEDGTVVGGLGSAVAEWMTRHHKTNRLRMMGVQDEFVHQGTVAQLYERCGMDAQSLEQAIKEELEVKS
jgi:1-deoxy-D-xylulose-5-phosphate synthase